MKTLMKSAFILMIVCAFSSLGAEVRLPAMVSDGMILQRDVPLKIWGWADPGEKVELTFKGRKYRTLAGDAGDWEIGLKAMEAGGPYVMEIRAENHMVIRDILVGDVWLCSGQSNMDHYLGRHTERYADEIASSGSAEIRQLLVPKTSLLDGPADDATMQWVAANTESVLDFTVVGYFFALKLYEEYGIPQGIIKASVGGSRIETWIGEEGLGNFQELMLTLERNKDTAYVNGRYSEVEAARAEDPPLEKNDLGLQSSPQWFKPGYKARNWKPVNVPGYWEDQGVRDLDGVVWYRRELEVQESMCEKEALLKLGRIVDADQVYINGSLIGETTYKYPQRRYSVSAGVLKPGKNLLVVRVVNQGGKGGFMPDKPYFLLAGTDTIDLKGTWEYRVGEVFQPISSEGRFRAMDQPASHFNGMIAPLVPYAIRGVVWYQGESNASDPEGYSRLLPALIHDWRARWKNPEMPFLIAQLPNYMDVDYLPAESQWAELREVQLQTALSSPFTGLGINIDLGEWNDIHPGNKKPVGERLALQAMDISYGEKDLVSSGPVFRSYRREGKKTILSFDHVGSGLVIGNGEELGHFALAGEDGIFQWAKAVIKNNEVVVCCDAIPDPYFLRYAWADNPDFANLFNMEGLPASPFRTNLK